MTINEFLKAQLAAHPWFDSNHATVILPAAPTHDDDPLLSDDNYGLYARKRPGDKYASPHRISTPKWNLEGDLPYPPRYISKIGQTGWDIAHSVTRYVCFEFDHEDGHGRGLPTAEIHRIKEALSTVAEVEVRESTHGAGLHVRCRLAEPIPTPDSGTYSAIQRAAYRRLCSLCPEIEGKIDNVALGRGNLWLWANVGTLSNEQFAPFTIISPATATLSLKFTPEPATEPLTVLGEDPVARFVGRNDLALGTKDHNGTTAFFVQCPHPHGNRAHDKTMVWHEDGRDQFRCFSDSCSVEDFMDFALRVAPNDEVYKKFADHGSTGLEYALSLMESQPLESTILNFLKPSLMTRESSKRVLIHNTLVEEAFCVIGAPEKGYKTHLGGEISVSLATATPFLGVFDTPRRRRVYFLAGENTHYEMSVMLENMTAARGLKVSDLDEYLTMGSLLPELSLKEHVVEIKRCFDILKPEVFILDSLYQVSTAEAQSNDAIFAKLLQPMLRICKDVGCTPIMLAHSNKALTRSHRKPKLYDMAGAGIAKMAGQWILTNHRKDWQDGFAHLHLCVGARAKHGGDYELDITDEPYNVVVRDRKAAVQDRTEAKLSKLESTIANYLGGCEHGDTKKGIIENCSGVHSRNANELLESLVQHALIEPCKVPKAAGSYEGYCLVQLASRRAG